MARFEVAAFISSAGASGTATGSVLGIFCDAVRLGMCSLDDGDCTCTVTSDTHGRVYLHTLESPALAADATAVLRNLLAGCPDLDAAETSDVLTGPAAPLPEDTLDESAGAAPFEVNLDVADMIQPVVRIKFRQPLSPDEEEAVMLALRTWDRLVNAGAYPSRVFRAPPPHLDFSECYLASPTIVEHPLYGLRAGPESFVALIRWLARYHRAGHPVEYLEIE